jgi:hypothetical protein
MMKKLVMDRIIDSDSYALQYFVCSEKIAWRAVNDFSDLQHALFEEDGAYSLLYDYSGRGIEAQRLTYGEPYFCAIWIKDLAVDIDEALLISEDCIALVSRDKLVCIDKVSVHDFKNWQAHELDAQKNQASKTYSKLSAIFEQASKKLPFPTPDIEGRRFVASLKATVEQRDIITELSNDLKQADGFSDTEKEAVIKSRVGQGLFRKKLIEYWKGCAVTGCVNQALLKASHIKPWAASDNIERLDVYNGLLLNPGLDVAFDAGLITFLPTGEMLVSEYLSISDLPHLGIFVATQKIDRLKDEHTKYLNYHREYVFERWLK